MPYCVLDIFDVPGVLAFRYPLRGGSPFGPKDHRGICRLYTLQGVRPDPGARSQRGPLYGVYVLGWSWGTVLVLYLCETVMGALFTGFRMIVHWQLTHDRGYSRPLFGTYAGKSRFGAFLFDFLGAHVFASFVHGIFLALILSLILKGRPEA